MFRRSHRVIGAIALVAAVIALPGVASATATVGSPPVVHYFKSSPKTVSTTGGSVTLTASLKSAQTCTLSVKPKVSGLPLKNFACSTGFSKAFVLKSDTGSSPRTYTFSLKVTNRSGSVIAPNVVVGEGAAPPPISFGGTSLSFGNVGVSIHSTTTSVTVTNNSTAAQTLGQFTITGPNFYDFGISSNDCVGIVLSPSGGNCSFTVLFVPTSSGLRSATINLQDLSWGSTGTNASLPVTGNGVFSELQISSPDFSNNTINIPDTGVATDGAPVYVQIENVSQSAVPLSISTITTSGANSTDFGIGGGNCVGTVLSPAGTCEFTIGFSPGGEGLRQAQIDVNANVSGGHSSFAASGQGVYATMSVVDADAAAGCTSTQICFGTTTSAGATHNITVTNTSGVQLQFTTLTGIYTGDSQVFVYAPNGCVENSGSSVAYVLPAGQSCVFTISFVPSQTGTTYDSEFSLFANVATASQTFDISATAS